DEQHVTRLLSQRRRYLTITPGFAFRPGRRVEIAREKRREIAVRGVGEEIALRLHAARRKNGDALAGLLPARQRRPHVGVDCALALQRAGAEARFPDPALERLQPG